MRFSLDVTGAEAVIQPVPLPDDRSADQIAAELLTLQERYQDIRRRLKLLSRQLAVRLGEVATGDTPQPWVGNPE